MTKSSAPTAIANEKKHASSGVQRPVVIRDDPLFIQNVFSENVRIVRRARGYSQEDLADHADLDRTYISSIERKLRNLSIQNIQRLATALQVEPKELLDPELGKDPRFKAWVV